MGTQKHYTGYRSYQYLKEDLDYKGFALAKETGRVPSRQIGLSPAEEQRVQELLAKNIAISMRDHPVVVPEDTGEIFEQKRRGRDFTGFAGLAASSLDCVFDNLMNGLCTITSQAGWKWNDVLHDLGMRLCDLAHQDFVIVCDGVRDIMAAHFSIAQVLGGKTYEEVEYVDGLENPADFPNIIRWLVQHGYSDGAIAKVMGGNALRVLKQVWGH